MRYIVDNDLHIHSKISACSGVPEQTPERILQYAEETGLKTICVTDHFWDSDVDGASEWYAPQDYNRIVASKPLPQKEGIRFLFGCETDLDKNLTLGISKEKYDLFDFIVIPTTHFHMTDFTLSLEEGENEHTRAVAWVKHFEAVLNMDLPFHKVGIAHLTCQLIGKNRERAEFLKVMPLIPDEEMERLFTKAAKLGVGIELNACDMRFTDEEADIVLRPYRIAKKCGCKFYFASDGHRPAELDRANALFNKAVDWLELTEDDKFKL